MIDRICLPSLHHSFFLFGARGTGKSTLLNKLLLEGKKSKNILFLDFLDPSTFEEYASNPRLLIEIMASQKRQYDYIIIDEVQKIPKILDSCHLLIEKYKKTIFVLTGSSARKLKRGQANLLAGRAFTFYIHPIVSAEIPSGKFNLIEYLKWGGLPKIFSLKNDIDKKRYLTSYVHTYIKEEIISEQLIRNINGFRSFLELAAQSNGKIINYSKMSKQSGVDDKSIQKFYEILQDTLIGNFLEPFDRSVRKRQSQKPKFYLFDPGVARSMTRQLEEEIYESTSEFGDLFEQMIINEFFRMRDYLEKSWNFYYLRTKDGVEIDLIIEQKKNHFLLIEIKSSEKILPSHYQSLIKIGAEFDHVKKIILCREKRTRLTNEGVHIFPWQLGLHEIFKK